jgi:hypothetical protein
MFVLRFLSKRFPVEPVHRAPEPAGTPTSAQPDAGVFLGALSMAKPHSVISPEEGAKLEQLYAELPIASKQAADAVRKSTPVEPDIAAVP